MKLLLDENLSPRLVHALADLFPGSKHVRPCGGRLEVPHKLSYRASGAPGRGGRLGFGQSDS